MKAFGFETAEEIIGQKIKNRSDNPNDFREVQGVVKDFHLSSLKNEIRPLLINFNPFRGHVLISLNKATYINYDQLKSSIDKVEKAWNEVYTDQVFDVQFMDNEFDRQYKSEISLRKVFTVFTFVSVFLSCLGLIGLSMFTALQRKSEVGVRKVLGASVWSILGLFSRDFLRQIVIAIILSIPLAYYLMDNWLQSYSYRTSLTVMAFIIPGLTLLVLGLVTIVLQTFKSARANPARVLRNE
jgi:putative ABC transport system permease protein